MEQYLKHIIRQLGLDDMELAWQTDPMTKRVFMSTLWRAYGTQECFGAFTWSEPMQVWCGHMYCRPAWRGKVAVEIFKQACWRMFNDIGCQKILGLTMKERKDAIVAARMIGFKRIGEADGIVLSLLEKGDI